MPEVPGCVAKLRACLGLALRAVGNASAARKIEGDTCRKHVSIWKADCVALLIPCDKDSRRNLRHDCWPVFAQSVAAGFFPWRYQARRIFLSVWRKNSKHTLKNVSSAPPGCFARRAADMRWSRMRSEVSRFILGVWGPGCVRQVAFTTATVVNRLRWRLHTRECVRVSKESQVRACDAAILSAFAEEASVWLICGAAYMLVFARKRCLREWSVASSKTVPLACEVGVCWRSVKQECPTRVSRKSVLQECQVRVSHKSLKQECLVRASSIRVSYRSQARMSCKSVK